MGGVQTTWYPDGTPYVYLPGSAQGGTNVGWLDAAHEFPHGSVAEEFVDALGRICAEPTSRTRGWHACELCSAPAPVVIEIGGLRLSLGSAEIRVRSATGKLFAAPDLIYHYVTAHSYKPPEEFVAAVLAANMGQSQTRR
jgi:hypothetical protein